MRKRILSTEEMRKSAGGEEAQDEPAQWLDLSKKAEIELTSERPEHPIEAALLEDQEGGWRAGSAGPQTIRLRFLEPQEIRRIQLEFIEHDVERTQEFVVRVAEDGAREARELLRQQWNFNPQGTTVEREDYRVELHEVALLELYIIPDISRGQAHASLARLRVG